MFLDGFIRRVKNAFRNRPAPLSEGDAHAADLERLDEEQPGWDRDARLASAQSALKRGMTREVIVSIYGEEMSQEAERLNQEQDAKKDA